ncbi:tRNA-splicing endonuclease subunit Sen2 [Eurosta solidaginis]|uniref:tRNA-splicing endonuclease subunit Sen2 n=1 Tax=Eurosta solidaginis TaxID=178769 RepID=UPI0035305FE8
MIFTPNIKCKNGVNKNILQQPFPLGTKVKGVFTGLSVEIYCPTSIKTIYDNGFYGKGSKSRGAPRIVTKEKMTVNNECLTLELEESGFLAYFLGVLSICDFEDQEIQWTEFAHAAKSLYPNYLENLAAYMYLKSKGWIIKSGIKFGGNFLIYKNGPRFNHASFIIIVFPTSKGQCNITTRDLKGMQRIAETSDKDILLLEITKSNAFAFNTLFDLNQFRVSETVIRRFNSTSFVQTNKLK